MKQLISRRCFLKAAGVTAAAASMAIGAPAASACWYGDKSDVTILYTNDVHTYIDKQSPKLTYAAIADLKQSYQNAGKDVLLVDAGDHVQGTAYGSMDEGASIIKLMNAAGYDVATPGNHEFDYGMDRAKAIMKEADFPYLSCNWVDLRTTLRVLPSVKVFVRGGRRIAFVGVTTPETFTKSTPAYFMDKAQRKYIYDIQGGEDGKKLYDAVQKAIDKDADVIFAPNSITVASSLLPQANDLGVECPIMAGDTWESSVILDGMANTGLNVYCSTFFDENDSASSAASEFVDGFKAWLNANSDAYNDNGGNDIVAAVSALGFDAYNVAMAAIRAAAEAKGADLTSVDVARALWTLTYDDAVTGKIQFNFTGDAIKNCAYIKKAAADGSKFEFVKTQEVQNDDTQATGFDYGDAAGVKLDTVNHKIVIGVYEPLTGNNGGGGKQEVLGIKYANSLDNKIDIAGEEYTVELYVSDNGSLEENAVSAASSIVSAGAMISLGSYGSGVSIAAADTFAEAQIPAIGVSCTNASVTDGHDWYFRICFLDPFQGSVMAQFAWDMVAAA